MLNDSASWTEEIARYLLVATVFSGAVIGVARNNHIQVDFVYRYLPKPAARLLASLVDLIRSAFYIAMVYLCYLLIEKLGASRMTVVDLPVSMLYWVCLGGFAAMALRSIQISVIHWQRGYSVLERPESSIHERLSVESKAKGARRISKSTIRLLRPLKSIFIHPASGSGG